MNAFLASMNKTTSVENKKNILKNKFAYASYIHKNKKENHEHLHTEIFQNEEKQAITGTKNEDNGAIIPKFKKTEESEER